MRPQMPLAPFSLFLLLFFGAFFIIFLMMSCQCGIAGWNGSACSCLARDDSFELRDCGYLESFRDVPFVPSSEVSALLELLDGLRISSLPLSMIIPQSRPCVPLRCVPVDSRFGGGAPTLRKLVGVCAPASIPLSEPFSVDPVLLAVSVSPVTVVRTCSPSKFVSLLRQGFHSAALTHVAKYGGDVPLAAAFETVSAALQLSCSTLCQDQIIVLDGLMDAFCSPVWSPAQPLASLVLYHAMSAVTRWLEVAITSAPFQKASEGASAFCHSATAHCSPFAPPCQWCGTRL